MSDNLPELDRHEERLPSTGDWAWGIFREHEERLDVAAAQKFSELHGPDGDRTVYLSKNNSDLLLAWLKKHNARVSLKNLEIAARELASELEQRPDDLQAEPTPTQKYNPPVVQRVIPSEAERQLHTEFVRAFRDDSTQPDEVRKRKLAELRRAAITERYARRPESRFAMSSGEARAIAAKTHPIGSPEFSAAVANLLRGEFR